MKIKVLTPTDLSGNFTFTKEALEKLLNEAYEDGYRDGRTCFVIGDRNYTTLNNMYNTEKINSDSIYNTEVENESSKNGRRD
jgi:hypothetical protein